MVKAGIKSSKLGLIFVIGLFINLMALGADDFSKGQMAFLHNRPKDAVIFFTSALQQNPNHPEIYLFLAVAYEQLGQFDQALIILQQAYDKGVGEAHVVLYNLANLYSRLNQLDQAVRLYSEVLALRPDFSQSLMNRGNIYVRAGKLQEAKEDYEYFIAREPRHPKVADVRQMITAINGELVRLENQRLAEELRQQEEQRRRIAAEEQLRLEAERKRLEAERRAALMDKVFSSLSEAQKEMAGLSGGTESVQEVQEFFGIED
jgi:tetratricopeptide (TPR) repeat protein